MVTAHCVKWEPKFNMCADNKTIYINKTEFWVTVVFTDDETETPYRPGWDTQLAEGNKFRITVGYTGDETENPLTCCVSS